MPSRHDTSSSSDSDSDSGSSGSDSSSSSSDDSQRWKKVRSTVSVKRVSSKSPVAAKSPSGGKRTSASHSPDRSRSKARGGDRHKPRSPSYSPPSYSPSPSYPPEARVGDRHKPRSPSYSPDDEPERIKPRSPSYSPDPPRREQRSRSRSPSSKRKRKPERGDSPEPRRQHRGKSSSSSPPQKVSKKEKRKEKERQRRRHDSDSDDSEDEKRPQKSKPEKSRDHKEVRDKSKKIKKEESRDSETKLQEKPRERYRRDHDDVRQYTDRDKPISDDEDHSRRQRQSYASHQSRYGDRGGRYRDRDEGRGWDRHGDDYRRRDRNDGPDRGRNRDEREPRRRRGDDDKENRDADSSSRKRGFESRGPDAQPEDKDDADYLKSKRTKTGGADDLLTTKTGGAYIPPARLRMMQAQITDKSSAQFQRLSWEALKKSLNGLINKVNVSNIIHIVRELFQENIVRGRGVLTRSIIQAQAASPTFTHVYAALLSIINTKFPQIGELLLRRVVLQFRKGFKRNNKDMCLSSVRFIAHLVNQQVAHEIIALEILTLLLENPTDDSVEVTVGFLKECGQKLTEVSPRGMHAIFERLRTVLHEGQIDTRTQYMVEVMFAVRKDGFKDHQAVVEELDLVEEQDQFTHMLTLDDVVGGEELLNVFKVDPEYEQTEEKYKVLKREILEEDSSAEEGSGSGGSGSDEDSDSSEEEAEAMIIDQTETNMVALRRTIYLTIQSSLDFEECAHKLLKLELKPGQEMELCNMILDCCAQQRTYEKFFGLLAQRFCMIDKKYVEPYQVTFVDQYQNIHRLETNKLRNIAKFFSHLLHTDAISWEVMQFIKLNEEDTTSSSRIFIKILFQELSEYLGLPKLNDRLKDMTLQPYFEGLFPRNNPRNTRFAINFFTSIGLGGLTDELRAHLKTMPKTIMQQQQQVSSSSSSDSSSSDDSDSSSSSDSDSDSSSSESSSSEEEEKRSWRKSSSSKKSREVKLEKSPKKRHTERTRVEEVEDKRYMGREKTARLNDKPAKAKDKRRQERTDERSRPDENKRAKSKKSQREELEERIERIDITLERRYRRVRSQNNETDDRPKQDSEWERDKDRERGRERDKDRERGRERDKDRERGRERDKEPERERDKGRHRERDRERDRGREQDKKWERERDQEWERERDQDGSPEYERRKEKYVGDRKSKRNKDRSRERDRSRSDAYEETRDRKRR